MIQLVRKIYLAIIIFMLMASCKQETRYKEAKSSGDIIEIAKESHFKGNADLLLHYVDFSNYKGNIELQKEKLREMINRRKGYPIKKIEIIEFKDYDFYKNIPSQMQSKIEPYKWSMKPSHILKLNLDVKGAEFAYTFGIFSKNGIWYFSCIQPKK
jgi:hypothetical protein